MSFHVYFHKCVYYEFTVSAVFASTFAFYEKGDVVELTPSNFDRLVIQSDEIWVVEVFSNQSADE